MLLSTEASSFSPKKKFSFLLNLMPFKTLSQSQALNLCSICVLFDHQRSYIDFQRASTNLNASQCKISISGQTRREYVEAGKVELRLKFALTCMGLHLHLTKALSQR